MFPKLMVALPRSHSKCNPHLSICEAECCFSIVSEECLQTGDGTPQDQRVNIMGALIGVDRF